MGQEVKTLARSVGDKAHGIALIVIGNLIGLAGIAIGLVIIFQQGDSGAGFAVGFFGFVIGFGMSIIGAAKKAKADHVSWTREAIERQAKVDNKGLQCPSCKSVHERGAKFCAKCGRGLSGTCYHCGNPMDFDAEFCTNCGQSPAAAEELNDN
jgi:membrane protease subunit (stomatin/prohibitin family)